MTASPVKPEGEALLQSPLGGRPFEWRALEEASAFEKWFEADASPTGRRGLDAEPVAARDGKAAGVAPRSDAPMPRERASPAPGRTHAEAPAGAAPRLAAEGIEAWSPAPQQGAAGGLPASRPQAARGERGSARAPAMPEATVPWSRLAVTAMLNDEKVRVWLRDYRLSASEIEILKQELRADLRRLGYRLAEFVVNGENRHGD